MELVQSDGWCPPDPEEVGVSDGQPCAQVVIHEGLNDTWATTGLGPKPKPHVFIQWKGTEVCLDFMCLCGYQGHYDGGFAYGLKCPNCETVWAVPSRIGLVKGDIRGQATDKPHRDIVRLDPDRNELVATFEEPMGDV